MTKITIERDTLLPCPFCGGEAEKDVRYQAGPYYGCDECGIWRFGVSAWNRRAALAAQQTSGVTCTMTDAPCTRNCGLACSLQMEALAAQPAEPVEPVMTIGVDESEKCRSLPFGMKLYAAPPAPAAVPLTEEVLNIHKPYYSSTEWSCFKAGVRFAEMVHGIAAAAAGDKP